ncbi:uncharacterized protein PV06_09322 [Exophiala oligosperma]|uniref:DNA (cytosine-5-)-methyltransferase n=2 Tax=Chaetothyriales TaxID=34395 RepID=A0A0D2D7H2_9EURO|nr:uncharacterized protein PV06_09322 [Exophiala oligosperma]KAJ9635275.1 hypothetical protein H2204_005835 [Knufia peltigerae]KIW38350.1 hypothetical protein PV06_09322 [Exophiala oligosperma]
MAYPPAYQVEVYRGILELRMLSEEKNNKEAATPTVSREMVDLTEDEPDGSAGSRVAGDTEENPYMIEDDGDDVEKVLIVDRDIKLQDVGFCSWNVQLRDDSFMRITSLGVVNNRLICMYGRRLVLPNNDIKSEMVISEEGGELLWLTQLDAQGRERGLEVRRGPQEINSFCNILFTNLPESVIREYLNNSNGDYFFCRYRRAVSAGVREDSGRLNRQKSGILQVISPEEADDVEITLGPWPSLRAKACEIREAFRGRRQIGPARANPNSYVFADFFSGAGGASQGAVDAGLSPLFALDHDCPAVKTYAENFARYGTMIFNMGVTEFLRLSNSYTSETGRPTLIDIAHMSPPCQPFSPANTTPNQMMNELNEATFITVRDLLEAFKPRMVTLEETDGLLNNKHMMWFRWLLKTFKILGYSVVWRSVEMVNYGVAQSRTRLILIAAGPGESLPPFPEPTHDGPGLKPRPSIYGAIGNITLPPDQHLGPVNDFPARKRPLPWNGLAGTVTTNGGSNNYHPDGWRKYTVTELAALQTFPPTFQLHGRAVTRWRKQIGNAVPPAFSHVLFKSIKEWLWNADQAEIGGAAVARAEGSRL